MAKTRTRARKRRAPAPGRVRQSKRAARAVQAGLQELDLRIRRFMGGWPPPPPLHYSAIKQVRRASRRLTVQLRKFIRSGQWPPPPPLFKSL